MVKGQQTKPARQAGTIAPGIGFGHQLAKRDAATCGDLFQGGPEFRLQRDAGPVSGNRQRALLERAHLNKTVADASAWRSGDQTTGLPGACPASMLVPRPGPVSSTLPAMFSTTTPLPSSTSTL